MNSPNTLSLLKAKLAKKQSFELKVKIIPKSKKNEIVGFMADGKLKIKISAVPEKGKANQALVRFLSDTLEIAEKNIELSSGQTSPQKIITFFPYAE